MKITKLLFAIGIITLLGAGCSSGRVAQNNSNTNVPPAIGTSRSVPASGEMTVTITKEGEFQPTTAFVKKGTVITFVNTSSKPHSIEPYADAGKKFDALASKKQIAPGEKFTVTMDQVGRWLYSDGTNTAFGGGVEVIE